MKSFSHIIILLIAVIAIFLEVQKTSIYYIWSITDTASFEEAYCVNLEYPELDCHGSCWLHTEFMQLSHDATNPLSVSATPTLDIVYFLAIVERLSISSFDKERVTHQFLGEDYAFEFPNIHFRPPIV